MRKYLVMVVVIVFVLTTIGIVRAAEGVTSRQTILTSNEVFIEVTFPFNTQFYVAEDKNVLQYQLPGEQTWKEIPFPTGYTIRHQTQTITISSKHRAKKITHTRVLAICERDTKNFYLITSVYVIQKHSHSLLGVVSRSIFWLPAFII